MVDQIQYIYHNMDELEELQRQLEEVQNEVETHKFSERNVVELMEKVVEFEKLDILHSMNGKEYLTSEHLATEILNELHKNGGRLDIIELPKLLDVSGDHIGKQIDFLIKKDKRKLFLVNDSLLTNAYLDSLAGEISFTLTECGSLPLSEISSTHDLPVDFLKIKFTEWIDDQKIKGKMHGGMIYNDSHIRREKCRIRGYVMATTRPVPISQAASDLRMEERLFNNLLDELNKSDEIKVKVQSDLIIPGCFERMQKNIALSFYNQNHYIEYSKLNKIMIRKHKDYLKGLNLDGIFLNTVFVDNSLISQVDSCVSDTLTSDQILDLHSQLPDCFTEDDLKELVNNCPSGAKATLFSHYVTGKKFIERCFEDMKKLATEYAKKAKSPKKSTKKTSGSPKKKKKGKQEDAEEEKIVLSFSEEIAGEELKKCENVKKEKLDEDEDFINSFMENYYSETREIYEEAYKEYIKEKLAPQKLDPKQFQDDIQKEFEKLNTAIKSLSIIEKLHKGIKKEEMEKILNVLNVHLVKKQVNPLFNNFVALQLVYIGVNIKDCIKDKSIALISTQERDKLLKQIPKPLEPVFAELNKLVANKDAKGFVDSVMEHKSEMAISLRPTDKKSERQAKNVLIHTYQDSIKEDNDDLKNILYNALSLIMVENGIIISLPEEIWSIEIMGKIAKGIDKTEPWLIEIAESVKAYSDCIKTDEDERSDKQIKFIKDYEDTKEETIKKIFNFFKPKE